MLNPVQAVYTEHLEKLLQDADIKNANLKKKNNFLNKNGVNILKYLWDSSLNFWYRFYPNNSLPSIETNFKVFQEEVKEFSVEIERMINSPSDEVRAAMAEELADVFVTGLMCIRGSNSSWEDIDQAIRNVCEKNDAKSHETHIINPLDGKITRKSKLGL